MQDPSKDNFCPYLTGSKKFSAAPPASVCQVKTTHTLLTHLLIYLLPQPVTLPVTYLLPLFTYFLTSLLTY